MGGLIGVVGADLSGLMNTDGVRTAWGSFTGVPEGLKADYTNIRLLRRILANLHMTQP